MSPSPRIAVIGLGEAGSRIAAGLRAAGADIVGFDIRSLEEPPVTAAAYALEAASGADVVLSITSAMAAVRVASEIAPVLSPGAVFADLTTGTPSLKKSLAALFTPGVFADVAILKPVPGLAEKVPMAVSGSGAQRLIEVLEPSGGNLTYVSAEAGDAATQNLLLNMLAEGVTGAVVDTLWAAESLNMQDWAYDEVLAQIEALDAEALKRMLAAAAKQFKRRQIELVDISEMLTESGYESTMVPPVQFNYGRIMHGKKIPHTKP
jgi:putative dehydrogenase